jgi:hypothetical protein
MEFAEDHLATNGDRSTTHTFSRMAELAFDSERKRMSTLHWVTCVLVAYVKGAPESVLPRCSRTFSRGSTAPMTPAERKAILGQSAVFAEEAYRVLAVATRPVESGIAETLNPDAVEQDLTFLGLVALFDPPHQDVPAAIARCRMAGIRVVMITGDHPLTALALARKIGLARDQSSTVVIEGTQLDSLDETALGALLGKAAATRVTEQLDPDIRLLMRQALELYTYNADLSQELGELIIRHRRRTDQHDRRQILQRIVREVLDEKRIHGVRIEHEHVGVAVRVRFGGDACSARAPHGRGPGQGPPRSPPSARAGPRC